MDSNDVILEEQIDVIQAQQEITENKQKRTKKVKTDKTKVKECKVILVTDKTIGVSFIEDGYTYGIGFENDRKINVNDIVKVEYEGIINTKSFKCKLK